MADPGARSPAVRPGGLWRSLLSPARWALDRALRDERVAQRLVARAMSTQAALRRIAARGLEIGTVIDVGASDGRWSLTAREVWPEARFHLVEANHVHRESLERLCSSRANFGYTLSAAGPKDGSIAFDGSNPFGGRAAPEGADAAQGVVPQRSLASLVEERRLPSPFLVKLDTHGYEEPILDGAAALFASTNLFVIEAYNFPIRADSLRFHELCGLMERRGFAVIDISEPMWRSRDASLWQFDLFFVPQGRPEFAYTGFK